MPNLAVGGVHGPVVEMASTVADRAASADSGAGPDTATDDDDDDDAAPADIYFFTARGTSSAAEVVHRAEIRRRARRAGAREEIVDHVDHPGASNPSSDIDDRAHAARISRARHVRSPPNGPSTGYYYYTAGAATYIGNPPGPHRVGPSPELSGLNPAGTYSPAGASAPIADPGGTYSAAGASAPTTDPAGTYSSPYALTRLFLDPNPTTPATGVLSFNSATAVADYYGATSFEASLANEFFAGYGDAPATMLITRYSGGGGRPHLYGANLSNLTLEQLQSISGTLLIDFQGIPYSGPINFSGVRSFSVAAKTIQSELNFNLRVLAVTVRKLNRADLRLVHRIDHRRPSPDNIGLGRH